MLDLRVEATLRDVIADRTENIAVPLQQLGQVTEVEQAVQQVRFSDTRSACACIERHISYMRAAAIHEKETQSFMTPPAQIAENVAQQRALAVILEHVDAFPGIRRHWRTIIKAGRRLHASVLVHGVSALLVPLIEFGPHHA